MAERRMFSKKIVQSARFVKMPASSRLLYYDLGLEADDDGVVEAYNVMRLTGATEDDLRILVAKGFIKILNEDLVTLIMDWSTNNSIRGDRYHPSIYKELILQLNDNQVTTNCQPNDNHVVAKLETEVRLGKVRLGKVSKYAYGDYSNVTLTDDERLKLDDTFGVTKTNALIKYLDEYIEMKGYKCKSCYLAIKKWVAQAYEEDQQRRSKVTSNQRTEINPVYDDTNNPQMSEDELRAWMESIKHD